MRTRSRTDGTRSVRTVYRAAVDSLALAAALLFCCIASAGAEPRFSFATTPGKLPKEVVPKHYALRIVPAATYDRFDGEAIIDIEIARSVPAIVVNAAQSAVSETFPDVWQYGIGALFVATVVLFPRGLVGMRLRS